jgi:hypothetical protein
MDPVQAGMNHEKNSNEKTRKEQSNSNRVRIRFQ